MSSRPHDEVDSSNFGTNRQATTTAASATKAPSTVASITPSKTNTTSSQGSTKAASGPEVKPGRGNGDGEAHSDDDLSKDDPWWKIMECLATEGKVNRALGNVVDLGGESE